MRQRSFVVLVSLLCAVLVSLVLRTDAAPQSEPGGDDASTALAAHNPDEFAWKLFLFVNQQAKLGAAGVADDTKVNLTQYDADRDVVWETWALSSGFDCPKPNTCSSQSEVFKDHGAKPVEWSQLPRGTKQPKVLSPDFKNSPLVSQSLQMPAFQPSMGKVQNQVGFQPFMLPPGHAPDDDESRMNRSTFDTIRNEGLYSVEGLERAATKATADGRPAVVTFDRSSKEVKARWIHLAKCDTDQNCADKGRYHWRTVRNGNTAEIWGLASLHIITKDLPNWFWSDFGHLDCEKPAGTACEGAGLQAETPLRDRTTVTSGGVRAETKGSKWENYRLRGTQIDFTTPSGVPTVLSNPIVEASFQTSSCITCHSYASVGLPASVPNRGTSLPLFANLIGVRNAGSHSGDIGKSDCRRLYGPSDKPLNSIACPGSDLDPAANKPLYFQTDFLWSIPFRALSEKQ